MSDDIETDEVETDEIEADAVDEVDEVDDDAIDGNTIPAANAQEVLAFLAKAVVEDPDAVEIDVEDGRRGLALNVRVGPGDMGRVIGKRGRVAQSIRTVVRAAAVKDGTSVDVEFVD